ncbi:MAG TPA: NAD+ synthase [Planctomycetota bacterium]|nr:NAD+ synthase [Planctomycetota bacterium]
MRVAVAQIDTTAGDIAGNARRIGRAWTRAREAGADLLVVPELAVVGYPPRDLLLRDGVVRAAEEAVARLVAEHAAGPAALLGTVVRNAAPAGRALHNAAVLARGGRIETVYRKRLLPTYDVFDETRYFAPGGGPAVVEVAGLSIGLAICEDLWVNDPVGGRRLYDADPPMDLVRAGAEVVVCLSASPYHAGKDERREALFAAEARRMRRPVVSVQLVGGNDDVLFDGRSRVFDAEGRVVAQLAAFAEDFAVVEVPGGRSKVPEAPPLAPAEELRQALVMGLRDYSAKSGLGSAVLGLSGGVDSAVVACLAVDALSASRVHAVAMPGPFSAPESERDAALLARTLGIDCRVVPIGEVYEAYLGVLRPHLEGRPFDTTEENVQARIRGNFLMALSNKFGHLVLTTGNKSELAVGYCTLYGDMSGGLAVISDVWKTRVYELARLYGDRIPAYTIERPPSAELRPDQLDTDSLPPYDTLDRILRRRVEEGASLRDLVADGEDPAIAERVLRMVERNEYKRRQMAPGLKVTPLAFGVGWRMPIARPVDLSGER